MYSSKLAIILREKCSELRAALAVEVKNQSNSKFTFPGGVGDISDFHTSIYDRIGNPNPNFEVGMQLEHENCTDMFETSNYHICTNARQEWRAVVDGEAPPADSMGHGREIKPLQEYLDSAKAKEAGLTRAEVIALVLYTGRCTWS